MNGNGTFANRVRQSISLLRHPFLKLYLLEGESNCGYLRVLVADDGSTLSYINELLFSEDGKLSGRGSVSALNASNLSGNDADVIIVGANLLLADRYAAKGFHIVPKWVELFLPVVDDPYQRLYDFGRQTRKYFKWMLKKANDAGFECDTTNEEAWFEMFYDLMYTPYARERYGGSAVIHNRRKLKKAFDNGAGIVAKKAGKPVAGTIVTKSGKNLRIPHVGVMMADPEPVRDGALFAMDYFIVRYAHECGYSYLDFGHSRPFLSDGPLKYKLNWHMDVREDDDGLGVFAIKGCSEQATKFFEANPFFHLTKEGLRSLNEEI